MRLQVAIIPTFMTTETPKASTAAIMALFSFTARSQVRFLPGTAMVAVLKLVLEQESKLLQEQNRIRVLELVGMYHISEEPLLDNLYQVLRNLDPKVYEQLKNEQEYLYKSLKAKELLYVQAYEKQLYPIVKNINQVVQDYCKSKGVKVLYKLNQLEDKIGYLEPQLDITNELLNRVYEIK
jgi:hypothetical protein